jgi:hypothetical protein
VSAPAPVVARSRMARRFGFANGSGRSTAAKEIGAPWGSSANAASARAVVA